MKGQKGISVIKLIIIIAIIILALFFIISNISQNAEFNRKKEFIEELNDSAIDYNVDVLKRNAIIVTYYPNAPDDLLFKEVATIDLELITAENVNNMLELYKEEQTAVMEFNDALLEYYREILQ